MDSYKLCKIRNFVFLFSVFFIFVNASYADQTDKVVRIGIYNNHPLVSKNAKGEPQGLFVDLINKVAAQEHWEPVFIFDTFSNCLQRLRNNELDLMTAIAHTEKRDAFLDFSEEIVCTIWGVVYVQPKSQIQSIFDLDGKKVAIMKKGIFGRGFKKLCKDFNINCIFLETPSQNVSLDMLKEGKVDAAIFNNAFKELYNETGIKETSIIYSPLKIAFAVPKGKHSQLLESLDANLREWKKGNNSVYSQSLKKWLGTIEVPKKYIPLWLLYPFLVTIGIIIIAILWVITLRNQITERRKVQEALLDSENRFQSLSDAAFEGILITEKGNILDANSTLAKMFDYSAEELVGMKADALAAKDAREEVQDKILSGYEKPYEILGLKKDGSTFPIEAQAKMFTYKGRQVRVTAIRDLTEQKKAEEEIKTLIGILPICSFCKNIRNDEGYYQQIEEYIHEHSGVDFSHTVCPDCMKKHYPEYEM